VFMAHYEFELPGGGRKTIGETLKPALEKLPLMQKILALPAPKN